MNLIDDPRLTAYALGEMTDEAERATFESELANDSAAQAEIEAIRATAGRLRSALGAVLATLTPVKRPVRVRGASRWKLAAAAAVVVGGIATAFLVSNSATRHQAVALRLDPKTLPANQSTPMLEVRQKTLAAKLPAPENWPNPSGIQGDAWQQAFASGQVGQVTTSSPGAPAQVPGAGARPEVLTHTPDWRDLSSRRDAVAASSGGPQLTVAADPGVKSNVPLEVSTSRKPEIGGEYKLYAPSTPSDSKTALATQQRIESLRASVLASRAQPTDTMSSGATARAKTLHESEPYFFRADVGALEPQQPALVQLEASTRANAESYAPIQDNAFQDPTAAPLSTFGVDVDTASLANVRRFLADGQLPPRDAVRIEELINYFPTSDAPPRDEKPFAVHTEVSESPWTPANRLVRIALKGKVIENEQRPASNLVFLIDVSGSMNSANKLPLVQRSLRKLVGQLGENDRVAIVVYAGSSGLVLPSTNASEKATILAAIDNLKAGGSTNGGEGIELAYKTAGEAFIKEGTNRVILCTDGDFNVGVTDRGALFDLIANKAKAGTFLSVCGFGTGNTKDDTMEGLADKGNGQYAYIDTDREADKVFVGQIGGTLVTIAKDVKLQLEFNPVTVKRYRLIGYENRVMAAQDFNNDLKDAGDIGAGHNVVALYEIEPTNARRDRFSDQETKLKYQAPASREAVAGENTTDLLTLKLRFKKPDAPLEQGVSELIETVVQDKPTPLAETSNDFRFSAGVAAFGMLLRDSPYKGSCSWDLAKSLATGGVGEDRGGYRSEFLSMIDQASRLR